MKPTIGRVVIYCTNGMEFAAIVTGVPNPSLAVVNLHVIPPRNMRHLFDGTTDGRDLEWIEAHDPAIIQARCWKWPERV